MELALESPDFKPGGMIPKRYTCDGEDLSPPLRWTDAPRGARSFAIICEDPDAPMETWVHWLIYSIPPERTELGQGIPKEKMLRDGTKQGRNSWGKIGYSGPCPPRGRHHRYFFILHALDTGLDLAAGAGKEQFLETMEGHTLAKAQVVGLYGRG